jgi:hypothetical protein
MKIRRHHGFAIAMWALAITLFMGVFLVLLVDLGRAYIVRTQLRAIADASALAAFNAYQSDQCNFGCPPTGTPTLDQEQNSRVEAAIRAAQAVAAANRVMSLPSPIALAENREIRFGQMDAAGNFHDVLTPPRQAISYPNINAIQIVPKLGFDSNSSQTFHSVFAAGTSVAATIDIGAGAIGSGAVSEKILLVELVIDSSFSMAYAKYCEGGALGPLTCDKTNGQACKGVWVKDKVAWVPQDGSQGGVFVTCPPKWGHGNDLSPVVAKYFPNDCGKNPQSKLPVWNNSIWFKSGCIPNPNRTFSYLPSKAQKPYPNLMWAPQPMFQVLESAKSFVDTIKNLNDPNASDLEKHRVGAYTFNAHDWSTYIYPNGGPLNSNYDALKSKLDYTLVYPHGRTAMCKGVTEGFRTLDLSWANMVQSGINPERITPVMIIISDLNEDEPNYDCGGQGVSGAVGRQAVLDTVQLKDDDFFTRVTGGKTRVTIFTVSLIIHSAPTDTFMAQVARNGGQYFYAPSVEEIDHTFDQIIAGLKRGLRLVK